MSDKRALAKLVKRARRGDAEAFGRLFDRFYGSVYVYVLHQVGNKADAEDITSGVFLDAFEHIGGFDWRGAGFSAWLFRIARNDVLDFFRKRGRSRETPLGDEVNEQPAATETEGEAETARRNRELLLVIRSLSEDQQQVVLLRLAANLSNRQIGEVLSRSEGAVKALQHRALRALRKKFAEHNEVTGEEDSGTDE